MICTAITSWPYGVGEPTRFDIRRRRLDEKAFVLATELVRAFISDFERCTRGIESVVEHAVTSSIQTKPASDTEVGSWLSQGAEVDACIEPSC
jgi:hypothetical protein